MQTLNTSWGALTGPNSQTRTISGMILPTGWSKRKRIPGWAHLARQATKVLEENPQTWLFNHLRLTISSRSKRAPPSRGAQAHHTGRRMNTGNLARLQLLISLTWRVKTQTRMKKFSQVPGQIVAKKPNYNRSRLSPPSKSKIKHLASPNSLSRTIAKSHSFSERSSQPTTKNSCLVNSSVTNPSIPLTSTSTSYLK